MGYTLSHSQKLQVIAERQRRVRGKLTFRQTDLAEWAKEKFSLKEAPSQATMSRILATKDISSLMKTPTSKRLRQGKVPQLEETLANWVREQQAADIVVKGETLRYRGKDMLSKLNDSLPDSEKISLQFSAGWLCNFLRRWNLQLSRTKRRKSEHAEVSATLIRELFGDQDAHRNDHSGHGHDTALAHAFNATSGSLNPLQRHIEPEPISFVPGSTVPAGETRMGIIRSIKHSSLSVNGILSYALVPNSVSSGTVAASAVTAVVHDSSRVAPEPVDLNLDASGSTAPIEPSSTRENVNSFASDPSTPVSDAQGARCSQTRSPVPALPVAVVSREIAPSIIFDNPLGLGAPTILASAICERIADSNNAAEEDPSSVWAKRPRASFWFVGVEKLSAGQFATRLINYVSKRVAIQDKTKLQDAVCAAAKGNGIDGDTVVRSIDDEGALAELLLDDFMSDNGGDGGLLEEVKLYFSELRKLYSVAQPVKKQKN